MGFALFIENSARHGCIIAKTDTHAHKDSSNAQLFDV